MTLNDIAWSFSEETYPNKDDFNRAVTEYQQAIYEDASDWKPDEIVFEAPEVQIQYMCWVKGSEDLLENEELIDGDEEVFEDEPEDDHYQVEIVATLKADNGKNFSALEFLMKTHNQQSNKYLGDHTFFEGIDIDPEIDGGVPLCIINCGS